MKNINAKTQDNFKNRITLLFVLFLSTSIIAEPMFIDTLSNASFGSSITSINKEANDSALYEIKKAMLLEEAQDAYLVKDWTNSRVLLNKFLALYIEDDYSSIKAKYLLSKVCLEQSDFEEAIKNMNEFLQREKLPKAMAQEIQFDLTLVYLKNNPNFELEIMNDIAYNYNHVDFDDATAILRGDLLLQGVNAYGR